MCCIDLVCERRELPEVRVDPCCVHAAQLFNCNSGTIVVSPPPLPALPKIMHPPFAEKFTYSRQFPPPKPQGGAEINLVGTL